MPKETFYHLSNEKRKKVEEALENEFGRTSLEKASISNIVQEAKIPRGSFYQYFEDKEDAIKYIMKKYMLMEKEAVKRLLMEAKGNIFDATLAIFDYMVSQTEKNAKINLYKNILQELKKNNINLFNDKEDDTNIKEINQVIDTAILNIQEEEELNQIMKIISVLTRTASIDVTTGYMSKKRARSELRKQLEILKKGMLK